MSASRQERTSPNNIRIKDKAEEEFGRIRNERDASLPMPKLILHALQVNICGGAILPPEVNGLRYLKFPLDALRGAASE